MRDQAGFFDIEERPKELSAKGDTLERLNGRCVGRYGLSFTCEREAPGRERPTLADPPQEAAAQADAQAHGSGERGQVEGASRRRARVRTREGADGTGRAHDRSSQSAGEDRACQPRLQHEANDLAYRPSRPGIGGRRRPDAGPSITPIAGSQATDLAFSRAEPTRAHPSRQGSWRCPP